MSEIIERKKKLLILDGFAFIFRAHLSGQAETNTKILKECSDCKKYYLPKSKIEENDGYTQLPKIQDFINSKVEYQSDKPIEDQRCEEEGCKGLKEPVRTKIVNGFFSSLYKLIKDHQPSNIIVALDSPGGSFRNKLYPEYKSNRPPADPEMTAQIPLLKEVIEIHGIQMISVDNYEADDVIGTIAKKSSADNIDTIIATGDKDLFQLIEDRVSIWYVSPFRGEARMVSKESFSGEKKFEGIEPVNIIDLKGIAGDPSDNFKGVVGVGDKSALALINEFGSLEDIYSNIEKIPDLKLRGAKRIKDLMMESKEGAFLSKELATIINSIPFELDFEDSIYEFPQIQSFTRDILELRRLSDRTPKKDEIHIDAETPMVTGEYRTANSEGMINLMISTIKKEGCFSFDTETSSLKPFDSQLVGISISVHPETAWYIPIAHSDSTKNVDQNVIQFLKDIFKDPFIEKVAHNANFDISVLVNNGFEVNNMVFDTMIAANLLGKKSNSLKNLALEILNVNMVPIVDLIGKGKDQKSFAEISIDEATKYSGSDADMTLRLKNIFEKDLEKFGLENIMKNIEAPLVPVIVKMEEEGVSVNLDKLKVLSETLKLKIEALEIASKNILGVNDINLRSSQQLSKVLIEQMGVPKTKKTKTGYTMDANTLETLLENDDLNEEAYSLIKIVLEHREFTKIKSTYADSLPELINSKTGKIHTYFNQAGTSTGRLSSSEPNLQNIPVRTEIGNQVRKAFEAKSGHMLVSADYSQIELKILAHLSEEPDLLKAFINNEDIHDATARTIYETRDVDKEQRRIAKILNFGVIYGLSPHGVARQTDLTRQQGKEFIDLYFGKYPGIKNYINEVLEFAKKNKYVETITGRRRILPEINSPNFQLRSSSERMAIKMPIQGRAADVLKIAMINIDNEINKLNLKAKMIIQVHDELIFEAPEEEVNLVKSMLNSIMPSSLELKVPLNIAISQNKTWGGLK